MYYNHTRLIHTLVKVLTVHTALSCEVLQLTLALGIVVHRPTEKTSAEHDASERVRSTGGNMLAVYSVSCE